MIKSEIEILKRVKEYFLYRDKMLQDFGYFFTITLSKYFSSYNNSNDTLPMNLLCVASLIEFISTTRKFQKCSRKYEENVKEYSKLKT